MTASITDAGGLRPTASAEGQAPECMLVRIDATESIQMVEPANHSVAPERFTLMRRGQVLATDQLPRSYACLLSSSVACVLVGGAGAVYGVVTHDDQYVELSLATLGLGFSGMMVWCYVSPRGDD